MKTKTAAPAGDCRPWPIVAGFFFMTLGVRLLFLLSSVDRAWPHSINYEGDAVIWARAADLFARGEVPDEGVPHRFYAMAYLFQWLTPTGGHTNYLVFKVFWCALSALASAVMYWSLQRHFRSRVALVATGLYVFSFGSTVLSTSLNVEGLYAPILVGVLAGTIALVERPRWWLVLALALMNALALLTREEHLVLLFCLGGYVLWRWRPKAEGDSSAAGFRSWLWARQAVMPGVIVAGAIFLCLPYSVHATRATIHYNTVPKRPPDFEAVGISWTVESRAFVESLPAFVRAKAVDMVNHETAQRGLATVEPDAARSMLLSRFGYLPDPLATPVFIASHGPMSFALSNHPGSKGGFSRSALETPSQRGEPRLNLTLPEHLRIFNHGYAVGWGYITNDVRTWIRNVALKLGHAFQGASLGFTAYNIPYGRFGERRSCDVLTPLPGRGWLWQFIFSGILIVGAWTAWKHQSGSLWLLVVAYKVVIVILYYGYARQAVSILPAFLVLAALGIDQVLAKMERFIQPPIRPRLKMGAAAVLVVAACGVDIHAAAHLPEYQVEGPVRPMPQWGSEAFGANAPIEIRPRKVP